MEINDTESLGLKNIAVYYIRRWKLFLFAFIFALFPATAYLLLWPKTYEFMARIQVQEDQATSIGGLGLGDAAGLMKSFGIGGGAGMGVSIEDEIAILTSSSLLSEMITDLHLNVEYSEPYSFYKMFNEAPLKLTPLTNEYPAPDDEYKFDVKVKNRNVSVKVKKGDGTFKESFTFNSLPAIIETDESNFRLEFDNNAHIDQNFKLIITYQPPEWLAEVFAEDFLIEEVSKSSNVIELSCTDHVKLRGKAMLDILIKKYNEHAKFFKEAADQQTMAFVEGRITNLVGELKQVELDIEKYKTRNNMTLLESDVLFYSEQMKELQVKIVEVEAQSYMVKMMFDYVKNPANKYEVVPPLLSMADGEQAGAIPTYNAAVLERDRLLKSSSPTNPVFKSMNEQVDKLRESVFSMIENTDKSVNQVLRDLKGKENALLAKLKDVPVLEREYVDFKRQQEILQGVYLILLQKREETVLSLGQQRDRGRIVDSAFTLKKAVAPRKLYAAIGILLFTIVVPVGGLFAKSIIAAVVEEYKRTGQS